MNIDQLNYGHCTVWMYLVITTLLVLPDSLSTDVCENVYISPPHPHQQGISYLCHFWINSSSIYSSHINCHYFTSPWWAHPFTKWYLLTCCIVRNSPNHNRREGYRPHQSNTNDFLEIQLNHFLFIHVLKHLRMEGVEKGISCLSCSSKI